MDTIVTAGSTIESSPRRRRRWLLGPALALLTTAALIVAGRTYILHHARARTAAIIARLDRLDPGWRFEEIEARRDVVPDAKNSALRVRAVVGVLPKDWPKRRVSAPPGRDASSPPRAFYQDPATQLDPDDIAWRRPE